MRNLLITTLLLICGCALQAQDLTVSEKLVERFTGPFHLRFILQPLMAIIFGIKDGRMDASLKKPPYILNIILGKERRRDILKHGLRSIAKVLAMGIVLDAIVQIYLFHGLFIMGAVMVGAVLIALPYALARGISNRLSKRLSQ
ncbi:MAG: hypothetical protein OER04_09875 [Cyclobacteriaceae bacterium]|nr:hypothetical protein [Cyclobacteriaceae bacterium]